MKFKKRYYAIQNKTTTTKQRVASSNLTQKKEFIRKKWSTHQIKEKPEQPGFRNDRN